MERNLCVALPVIPEGQLQDCKAQRCGYWVGGGVGLVAKGLNQARLMNLIKTVGLIRGKSRSSGAESRRHQGKRH